MRLSFITSADGLCNGDVLDRMKLSEDLPDRYVISFTYNVVVSLLWFSADCVVARWLASYIRENHKGHEKRFQTMSSMKRPTQKTFLTKYSVCFICTWQNSCCMGSFKVVDNILHSKR